MNKNLIFLRMMFFLLFVFMFSFSVYAGFFSKDKEVWMHVNQTEYYVPLNSQVTIPLELNNDFNNSVDALFTFTIMQSIQQGGSSSSSTNSQTRTMSIAPKNQTLALGMGPSSTPGEIDIGIVLSYTDPKTLLQKTSTLDGIKIYFIDTNSQNESEKQNQQQKSEQKNQGKKSESSTEQKNGQNSENNQNLLDQLKQQMGQQEQQQQPQTQSQQNLQNNQQAQDMNALKQQMQQQQQEQQMQEQQLKQNVAADKNFQNEDKKLQEQGYQMQSMNVQPESNNSGPFQADYKNAKGETAQMKGNMQNNSMQNLQSQTQEQRNSMESQMLNSSQYKKMDSELKKNGFNQTSLEHSGLSSTSNSNPNSSTSTITATYVNEKNETAHITSDFVNNTLKKVDTDFQKEDKKNLYFWLILGLFLLFFAGFILYKFLNKKKAIDDSSDVVKVEKPFNYMSYCKHEIEAAKKLFDDSKSDVDKKESYAKCANALRVFYSHKFSNGLEIVNSDCVLLSKKNKFHNVLLNDTLNLCMMVEFAKYKPNKSDFNEIYANSKKILFG